MPSEAVSGPNASGAGRSLLLNFLLKEKIEGLWAGLWQQESFHLYERAGLKRLIEDVSLKYIMDFKMPRRQRQRERQKSNSLNKQNNNSRASCFVHFFVATAPLRRENT